MKSLFGSVSVTNYNENQISLKDKFNKKTSWNGKQIIAIRKSSLTSFQKYLLKIKEDKTKIRYP